MNLTKAFEILKTIRGIGGILELTIMLEMDDIHRFTSGSKFASGYRCIESRHISNRKNKEEGNPGASNISLPDLF
ncbi:transposase [Nitrosomonas sp. Nm132]|uniref:transposase n=1 Tax=Nitrosomonas sp. Nm132 TaxID=1881053 RepID=UPI000B864349